MKSVSTCGPQESCLVRSEAEHGTCPLKLDAVTLAIGVDCPASQSAHTSQKGLDSPRLCHWSKSSGAPKTGSQKKAPYHSVLTREY